MSPAVARGRYRFPRMVEETHGPWIGVKDGYAATEGDPQHAQQILNGWIANPGQGPVLPRPTFTVQTGTQIPGIVWQGLMAFAPANALPYVVGFAAGRMYKIDTSVQPWVVMDITPPGTVLIATNSLYIYGVMYAGKLVVSDGINNPWTWDGTTAVPIDFFASNPFDGRSASYGPPAVYYDQLFFILNSDRRTLMYSEPNNPTLGYVQTIAGFTYADTWTLEQTGTENLRCILGTNTALFYWRESSMGALYGSPALNFSTTATHDAISGVVGTVYPGSIVLVDREIFFLDQFARPHVIEYGGFLVPIWKDCYYSVVGQVASIVSSTQEDATGDQIIILRGAYNAATRTVLWSSYLGNSGPTFVGPGLTFAGPNTLAVFDVVTKKFLGNWTYSSLSTATGFFLHPVSVPRVVRQVVEQQPLAEETIWFDGRGFVISLDSPVLPISGSQNTYVDQSDWVQPGNSAAGRNSYAIEYALQTAPMGYDPWVETIFDRVEWVTLPYLYFDILADYLTPRSQHHSTAINVVQPVTQPILRSEVSVGINGVGRWIRLHIQNTPHTNQPNMNCVAVTQVKLRGAQVDIYPTAP